MQEREIEHRHIVRQELLKVQELFANGRYGLPSVAGHVAAALDCLDKSSVEELI